MSRACAAVFRPIGEVEDGAIRLDRRWTAALNGIEGFSHLIVLYWLDKAKPPTLRYRPKGIPGVRSLGCLAIRTPDRPNPIGMTVVRLLRRRGGRLWVEGLDAWPGTPILDIKPYTRKDAIKAFRMPSWVRRLDRAETDPLRRYSSP